MRKLRLLIVAIVIPFALCGENISYDDLPYDYIDHSQLKITKDNVEQVVRHNAELRKQQKEPDGFFIGIGGVLAKPSGNADGYSRDITVATAAYGNLFNMQILRLYAKYNPTDFDGGVSALLGYKWFFGGGGFGMRYYLDYNARFLELLTSHNFTANFDMLFNFVKTRPFKFGMILGIGYGLVYERVNKDYCKLFEDCNIISESIKGNFGLRFVIYDNSAIEVLFQPQYSGTIFANSRQNSYNYGYYNNLYSNAEDLLNGISETALIGTIRFIYTF